MRLHRTAASQTVSTASVSPQTCMTEPPSAPQIPPLASSTASTGASIRTASTSVMTSPDSGTRPQAMPNAASTPFRRDCLTAARTSVGLSFSVPAAISTRMPSEAAALSAAP